MTEDAMEEIPNKACQILNMQANENCVHSNRHKGEEREAKEGSRSKARNGLYKESFGKRSYYTVCN